MTVEIVILSENIFPEKIVKEDIAQKTRKNTPCKFVNECSKLFNIEPSYHKSICQGASEESSENQCAYSCNYGLFIEIFKEHQTLFSNN